MGSLDNESSITEETIEGSLFPAFDYGIQNSVGYHCQLVLDAAEDPVAFYAVKADQTNFGDQTAGLRVARRTGEDTWQLDWVDEDCEVVALSVAQFGPAMTHWPWRMPSKKITASIRSII